MLVLVITQLKWLALVSMPENDLGHLPPREDNNSQFVFNPLTLSIKLQILLLCSHTFLTEVVGEAVRISIELNLGGHVLNSHDLTNR